MNITIYIEDDGSVTITDCPADLFNDMLKALGGDVRRGWCG